MTKRPFDRDVDEARKRLHENACPDCGATYTYRPNGRRIRHAFDCPQYLAQRTFYSRTAQDRHAAGLAGEVCRHGWGHDWPSCPACSEEADRTWKERPDDFDPYEVDI